MFNRIAEVMARKQIKVKTLADKVGTTAASLTNWRKQHKQPNLITIYKLAAALDVEAAELLAPVNPFADPQPQTNEQ